MRVSDIPKEDRKQVSFYWSRSELKNFESRYPGLVNYFLKKCLELSLERTDFVSKVLLKDF